MELKTESKKGKQKVKKVKETRKYKNLH